MTACEVTRSLQLVGVPKSLFPSLGRTLQRQHFASLLLLVGDVPESTLSGTQHKVQVTIPGAKGAKVEVVDQKTGFNPPVSRQMDGEELRLESFAVAVVTLRGSFKAEKLGTSQQSVTISQAHGERMRVISSFRVVIRFATIKQDNALRSVTAPSATAYTCLQSYPWLCPPQLSAIAYCSWRPLRRTRCCNPKRRG